MRRWLLYRNVRRTATALETVRATARGTVMVKAMESVMEPGKARVTASVTELETARATASVTVLEMARATVSATVPGMAGAMAAATAGEGTAADKEKSGAIRLPLFFLCQKEAVSWNG